MSSLVVRTECATCGASLDFTEGTNALQCGYCGSNLLVTGRKQVLSYYVAPKMDARGAQAAVKAVDPAGGRGYHIAHTRLYFIPYYRLTGHDFQWQLASSEHPKNRISVPGSYTAWADEWTPDRATEDFISTLQWVGGLVGGLFGNRGRSREPDPPTPGHLSVLSEKFDGLGIGQPQDNEEIRFRDRYVEKNFVACGLEGLELYSLGVRPAVLRLELFRREVLEATGGVVKADMTPEAALARGMMTADAHRIVRRAVLSRILSLVYFPFWVVEVECRGQSALAIVDAVSDNVLKLDAPPSLYASLDSKGAGAAQTLGFRPLTCPNCGWDFPVKPADVIFVCSSCDKAWHIHGSDLYEVAYQVAEGTNAGTGGKYLPFWVLDAEIGDERPYRFFLPAFRYRRLKFLSDLARNISRQQPSYAASSEKPPDLHGCYYDVEDAVLMAQFTHAGLTSRNAVEMRRSSKSTPRMTGGTLTWFPFKHEGISLRDPFTRTPLPRNLLL